MTRRMIGTVLAASLAMTTATAMPARAHDHDLAKIVVGAATLLILGAAISGNSGSSTTAHVHHGHGHINAHKHGHGNAHKHGHGHGHKHGHGQDISRAGPRYIDADRPCVRRDVGPRRTHIVIGRRCVYRKNH